MGEAAGLGLVDILRVVGALAVVTGLAVGFGWMMRRGSRGSATRRMVVEERLNVSRGVQLLVVEVEARRLLVGVSEKGVNLVTELADVDLEESASSPVADKAPAAAAFTSTIDFAKVLASRLKARSSVQ